MQNPSNFDEKWRKKETQHFKHQLPSRLMFMKKTQDLQAPRKFLKKRSPAEQGEGQIFVHILKYIQDTTIKRPSVLKDT